MNISSTAVRSLKGVIEVPADKSITHRAILLSALAKGQSKIHHPLASEDCLSTLQCIQKLGCNVTKKSDRWSITGTGLRGFTAPKKALDCGNSGTTMRLLSGVLAAQKFSSSLVGDASLSRRPMKRVADPLIKMGATIELKEGKFAPIKIKGPSKLNPIQWSNPVASAQVKSAVLLAALHTKGQTEYEEHTLSRDHTERMLMAAGVDIKRQQNKVLVTGPGEPKAQEWFVPGDFSSAAFFLVAALLKADSELMLRSVNLNPTRTALMNVLLRSGAKFGIKNQREIGGEPVGDIYVDRQLPLKPIKINTDIAPRLIDEVPILAVAATQAQGLSELAGIGELRYKETDRISALVQNLRAMGGHVKEQNEGILIEGPTYLKGANVSSFGDHRLAMAFAVAALLADGSTTIDNSECVNISYPSFWETLKRVCLR